MKYTLNSTETGNSSTFITESQLKILENQVNDLQEDVEGLTETLVELQFEINDTGVIAANNLQAAVRDITAEINNVYDTILNLRESISEGITTQDLYASRANISKIDSTEINAGSAEINEITADTINANTIEADIKANIAEINLLSVDNVVSKNINTEGTVTANKGSFDVLNADNFNISNLNLNNIKAITGNFEMLKSDEVIEFVGDYDDKYHFLTLRGTALLYNENSTIFITPSGVFSNFERLKAAHFKDGKASIYFENGATFHIMKFGPVLDMEGGAISKTYIQPNVLNGNALNVSGLDLSQFIAKNDIQF